MTHVLLHNISNCNSEFILLWTQNICLQILNALAVHFQSIADPKY